MDIETVIGQMTLEEKVAFCSGKNVWETKAYERYGIPTMFMCDGPHGLRKQGTGIGADIMGINDSQPATCFPSEVTTAGSWDPELLREIGVAVGEEARAQKVGLVLGPGANIKRNPLCGRNFEYFSEDPVLTGHLAAGFIRGVESQGIGTSLKHFACNSQELDRFTSDGVVDERTLRELYLTAFEIAVKEAQPSTVMCAYPKLNGIHCSDHQSLLTDILRREWGFDGMVVTDWGAMSNRIEAFRAGCDLNMPGGSAYMEKAVCAAVRSGLLPEEAVDDSVRRLLRLVLRAEEALKQDADLREAEHHALAVKAAEKGAVLLKNESQLLPVHPESEKLAVIGYMAQDMRIQGAGSSHIQPTRRVRPLDLLPDAVYAAGCKKDGSTDDVLLEAVKKAAAAADKVIVFAGLPDRYESEGFDRETLAMPEGQVCMIRAAAEANPNTIVVLLCGSAVECPWAEDVGAILYMGLPGQGGAEAAYHLLTGEANPSGRLAESWPYRYADVPSSEIYGKTRDALYQEGIYVGYRYYEKAGVPVRWPFGYGLSYTTFSCNDMQLDGDRVHVTVTNAGHAAGEETVQLFISREEPQGIHRPLRELKAFGRVYLQPGESKRVTLALPERAFSVWYHGWVVEPGTYRLQIGTECCHVHLKGMPIEVIDHTSWYRHLKGKPVYADWEAELGRKYTAQIQQKGAFTLENTIEEMKEHSLLIKMMYGSMSFVMARMYGGKDTPEYRMMMKTSAAGSIRSMQMFSGLPGGLFESMVELANGRPGSAIKKLFGK